MSELKIKPLPTDISFKGLFAANTIYKYFLDADSQPFRGTEVAEVQDILTDLNLPLSKTAAGAKCTKVSKKH